MFVISVLAALTFGASGCGSNALSSTQLAYKANAVCKKRSADVTALKKQHRGDFRGLLVAAAPVLARAARDLRGLQPPSSAKVAYSRFVDIDESYIAQLERGARKGFNNSTRDDTARVREVSRLRDQLGLNACPY
jgi:hypothetical protein